MKIKTKNAKNGVTSTVNLTLHKDLILKTLKQREKSDKFEWWKSKKLHMERHYEGSNILESRTHFMSLHDFTDLYQLFYHLWHLIRYWIYEKSHKYNSRYMARNINSPTQLQKIPFCKCTGECPLENAEQNTWKKLVTTLICKLIFTKTDWWPCRDMY